MTVHTAPGQSSLPPPTAIPLVFSDPGPSNSTSFALSLSPEEPPQARRKSTHKSRRKRQHIELSSNQPLTVKGTQRTRVYTACLPCRSRKTRCDGARPACKNCVNRASGDPCLYDEMPNRRGPDKDPGARQRAKILGLPSEPRRRRRNTSESGATNDDLTQEDVVQDLPLHSNHCGSVSQHPDDAFDLPTYPNPHDHPPINGYDTPARPVAHDLQPKLNHSSPTRLPGYNGSNSPPDSYLYITSPAYVSAQQAPSETYFDTSPTIIPGPSLSYTRQTWWDSLLTLYATSGDSLESVSLTLTHTQRESASNHILFDIKFLFRVAPPSFCFFNVPRFSSLFSNHSRLLEMQPSYILAMLALATFLQSSETGLGAEGRKRALRLRDEAQSAMEASVNAGRVNPDLAKAAWLIAFFEVCSHPRHSTQRVTSSMAMLDSLVGYMHLMTIDVGDARVIRWPEGVLPIVPRPRRRTLSTLQTTPSSDPCSCREQTLGQHWPLAANIVPSWTSTPAWPDESLEPEIQKEESRRLVWSSIQLFAEYNSYSVARGTGVMDFALCKASNYAFLFPGEVTTGPSARDTVWSIYFRATLLWNGCIGMRGEMNVSDSAKAKYAMEAWKESCELDNLLDHHTCDTERAFLFVGREFLFNVRTYISQEFRQVIPLAQSDSIRRKAEEWLSHQAMLMNHLMESLPKVTGHSNGSLMYRPFFVFWFMGQIFRALTSWSMDNSLLVALDVGKAITIPAEYLMSLFPCDSQRVTYESVREQLVAACISARIPPPPPLKVTLRTVTAFVGMPEHLEGYHDLPQSRG
ncbi:hypothetical protein BJ322DRAFT_1014096 [Thelephora terrestris]|uniref:Zn(2)-C6 fungal-type domain-containing protein n=1 Tax=Thelephora terrestris TaxID=56493 RepID=A0A9P6L1U2_9AGAM|nr:hypothetical protein BJ322DRAFT_1014096 [Thelephora terrestris]